MTDTTRDDLRVAERQLARMRGMNAAYHRRFFGDVRWATAVTLILFAAGFGIDGRLFMAIPVVALMGACQTAFDASYLIFSRQYSTRLEQWINRRIETEVLVAHRIEDSYLFPLDTPKIVTVSLGRFSWFGFMTILITTIGAGVYVAGLTLALDAMRGAVSVTAGAAYVIALAVLTAAAAAVGTWWFVGGEGERRITQVLDETFPTD